MADYLILSPVPGNTYVCVELFTKRYDIEAFQELDAWKKDYPELDKINKGFQLCRIIKDNRKKNG